MVQAQEQSTIKENLNEIRLKDHVLDFLFEMDLKPTKMHPDNEAFALSSNPGYVYSYSYYGDCEIDMAASTFGTLTNTCLASDKNSTTYPHSVMYSCNAG